MNEKEPSLFTSFLIMLFVIAIKILFVVVIPSFLLSQVFHYFRLDVSAIVISKVIISLWLISFIKFNTLNIDVKEEQKQ